MKNSKKLFAIFNNFHDLKDFNQFVNRIDEFNEILDIFAKYPNQIQQISIELKNKGYYQEVCNNLIEKELTPDGTSSMSLKALDLFIKEEIKDNGKIVNQKYKSLIDANKLKDWNFDVTKSKYIDVHSLNDEILSPTTKCTFRETLKVFNKILKKFVYNGDFYLKNIVIEMPTEWNSVDERKRLNDIKNANEKRREFIKRFYDGENRTIIDKLILWNLQEHKEIYTEIEMDPDYIINDPNYCEIDHIVPYSISFDDSWNNKVLAFKKSNQDKGKRVPKEYLPPGQFFELEPWWKRLYLDENSPYKDSKKYELLTIDPINDRRQYGFIGRNLADTRYASRVVNQALNTWLKQMQNNKDVKDQAVLSDDEINIIGINGRITQKYRSSNKFLNIPKKKKIIDIMLLMRQFVRFWEIMTMM